MNKMIALLLTLAVFLPIKANTEIPYQPRLNLHADFQPMLKEMVDVGLEKHKKGANKTAQRYLNDPSLFDAESGVFLDAKVQGLYQCRGDIKFEEVQVHQIITDLATVYLLEKDNINSTYSPSELAQLKTIAVKGFKQLVDEPLKCPIAKVRWGKSNKFGEQLIVPLYAGFVDQQYPPYTDWAKFYIRGWDQSNGGGANGLDGVTANLYSLFAHAGIADDGAGRVYRRYQKMNPYTLVFNEARLAYKYMTQRTRMTGFSPLKIPRVSPGIRADFSYFSHGNINMTHSYGTVLRAKAKLLLPTFNAMDFDNNDAYSRRQRDQLAKQQLQALNVIHKFQIFSTATSYPKVGTYLLRGRGYTRATSPMPTNKPKGIKPIPTLASEITIINQLLAEKIGRAPLTNEELWQRINGVKDFPDGDHFVNRSHDYSMTIYAASRYTRSTEQHNKSNRRSTMIGKGAYDLSVYGDEYKNIQPILNWDVLPGVTGVWVKSDHNGTKGKTPTGDSYFNGGLENQDDNMGIVAVQMRYPQRGFAKKGYFVFEDTMVCLGSDIYSKRKQPMATSLNQALAFGDITYQVNGVVDTLAPQSSTVIPNGVDWVHHYGIGYLMLENSKFELFNKQKSGTWRSLSNESTVAANANGVNQQDVFGLYIRHGIATTNNRSSYAYAVKMNASLSDTQAMNKAQYVITNTPAVQAVRDIKADTLQLIFWQAGEYIDPQLGTALKVKVNEPALLMITAYSSSAPILYYADPSEQFRGSEVRTVEYVLPSSLLADYQSLTLQGLDYKTKDRWGKRTVTLKQGLY